MKQLPDNILKGMVLNAIISGYPTLSEIRNHIATTPYEFHSDGFDEVGELYTYQNYDGLKSALNYYRHQKLISIVCDEKNRPRRYRLTSLGYRHAQDPMVRRNYRRARTEEEVCQILMNDQKFRQAVQEQVEKLKPQKIHTTVEKPLATPVDNTITVKLEDGTKKEIEFDGNEIKAVADLKEIAKEQSTRLAEYENAIRWYQSQEAAENFNDIKQLNKELTTAERIAKRQALVDEYITNNYIIDMHFFKRWGGNMVPVTIRKVWDWYNPFLQGSVEIMTRSNREFHRGHAEEMNEDLILNSEFYFFQEVENGIEIFGNGMKEPQLLKW